MHVEKIVVGNSVNSLFYAFLNNCLHISNSDDSPVFYEKLEDKLFGTHNKKEAWTHLRLMLSYLGRHSPIERNTKIKINENCIKFIHLGHVNKLTFNNCYIFQSENVVTDADISKAAKNLYKVIDDFEIKNLGKISEIEQIKNDQNLIKRMVFYNSGRVSGYPYVTDCVTESILTKEELIDVEFSDSYIKLMIQNWLTTNEYNGRIIGSLVDGAPKYLAPELTHVKREVVLMDKNKYKNTEFIKFMNLPIQEIIDEACS